MADLSELQRRRALYVACETAILTGAQEYKIGNMSYRRADLPLVQAEIKSIDAQIAVLSNGGMSNRVSWGDRG